MRCPICGEKMGVDDNIVIFRGEAETIVDLPADLQDVYNVLHLTEKQFEVLDNFLEKALAVMENEQKYEKALELSVRDGDKCGVDIYCDQWPCVYDDSERLEHCCECGIKYYKQQAGLEVSP